MALGEALGRSYRAALRVPTRPGVALSSGQKSDSQLEAHSRSLPDVAPQWVCAAAGSGVLFPICATTN